MTDASTMPSDETPESADASPQAMDQSSDQGTQEPVDNTVDDAGDSEVTAVDAPVEAESESSPSAGVADSSSPSAGRLEEEGDIAADYVEELLDISDLDGDIDIEVRNGRTYVSVIAEDGDDRLQGLVGKDGKGLEALQELVRLAVLSATGNRSRLVLDIAGHRTERARELEQVAQDAITKVRESGEPLHLKPMGAYERKIVHDVIAEAGLVSESEGEGPRRHVVVSASD